MKDAPELADLMSRIGKTATSFGKMTDKITVRGTFSTAAAWGMATAGSAAERTAKATEDTAKNTRKIEKKTEGTTIT